MLEQMVIDGGFLLRNMIQKDPQLIVAWLSSAFGYILDWIYNFVNMFSSTGANTLGFAIIIMTIVSRVIMLPLNIKSHKSMAAMQKLQPEMEKIKAKYGDSKDPEIQRKMSMEINGLYSKHKANPIAGCLPIFIQFPIFMALYYIMNQPYHFISKLGDNYRGIADHLIIEGTNNVDGYMNIMKVLVEPKAPKGMEINMMIQGDVVKAIGKFTPGDWEQLLANISSSTAMAIEPLLKGAQAVENFFGIITTENTSWAWPSILIPVLCVIFTFLTSYLSNKQSQSTDPNVKMQQNMMMFGMPIMMGFITMGMPAGVGIYWVTSNATQIVQQLAFTKIFNKDKPESNEIVDPKQTKNNKKK